jgi:hypothetical protein
LRGELRGASRRQGRCGRRATGEHEQQANGSARLKAAGDLAWLVQRSR